MSGDYFEWDEGDTCDDYCGRQGGSCQDVWEMDNNHCGADYPYYGAVNYQRSWGCDQDIMDAHYYEGLSNPSFIICVCESDGEWGSSILLCTRSTTILP